MLTLLLPGNIDDDFKVVCTIKFSHVIVIIDLNC